MSKVYVLDKSFKNDKGENIDWAVLAKSEPVTFKTKAAASEYKTVKK